MGRSTSMDLRQRIIERVDAGHSNRSVARHFDVAPRTVNSLVKRYRQTGSIAPLPQGNQGRNSRIAPHRYWILLWFGSNADATIDEVVTARSHRGYASSLSTVWRTMSRGGLTNKKKTPEGRRAAAPGCGGRPPTLDRPYAA